MTNLHKRLLVHAKRSGLQKPLLVYDPHCDVPRLVGIGKRGYIQIELPFSPSDDMNTNRLVGLVKRRLRQLMIATIAAFVAMMAFDTVPAEARGCWITGCRSVGPGRNHCTWQCSSDCEGQHLEALPNGGVRLHYRCRRPATPPPYSPPPPYDPAPVPVRPVIAADLTHVFRRIVETLSPVVLLVSKGAILLIGLIGIAYVLRLAWIRWPRRGFDPVTIYPPSTALVVPGMPDPMMRAAQLFARFHNELAHVPEPRRTQLATERAIQFIRNNNGI